MHKKFIFSKTVVLSDNSLVNCDINSYTRFGRAAVYGTVVSPGV